MFLQNEMRARAERAAVRAQTKKEALKQHLSEKRSDEMSKLISLWKNDIMPAWTTKRTSSKVKVLVKQGVPPSLRGDVWSLMIGNDIAISEEVYAALLKKAVNRFENVKSAFDYGASFTDL